MHKVFKTDVKNLLDSPSRHNSLLTLIADLSHRSLLYTIRLSQLNLTSINSIFVYNSVI